MFLISFLLSPLHFLLESDCNKCVSEFDDNGGCDCMNNPSCDVSTLIPEGCYHCGDEAAKYCTLDNAGSYANTMISSQPIFNICCIYFGIYIKHFIIFHL